MRPLLFTFALSVCLSLAVPGAVQAQLPVGNYYNTSRYVASNNAAYRNAMSRTPRPSIQAIRYNGYPTNYGLGTLTTGVNALMMMNGMIPGASAYSNQGYNNANMNQGYNPYMYQEYNPYMTNPYNYGSYP
ncbi:MAG: hypothetical protein EXS16_02095 [Gemmataceae bacterium]|nr:hypothetical protein [Gemmataceae bacterium]